MGMPAPEMSMCEAAGAQAAVEPTATDEPTEPTEPTAPAEQPTEGA